MMQEDGVELQSFDDRRDDGGDDHDDDDDDAVGEASLLNDGGGVDGGDRELDNVVRTDVEDPLPWGLRWLVVGLVCLVANGIVSRRSASSAACLMHGRTDEW